MLALETRTLETELSGNPLGLRTIGVWASLHVSRQCANGHYPKASPIAPAAALPIEGR
jgi:hypothetical protein